MILLGWLLIQSGWEDGFRPQEVLDIVQVKGGAGG